jgi:excisionase family DNA binding protein
MASDYYSTGEAARILRLTEGRIRQMLLAGELEGERDPLNDRWRIPQAAVHALKEQRTPFEVVRRAEEARRNAEVVGEWIEKVEQLRQELGRMEGRLELTAQAESTLREQLERERGRADRLEERAEQLRDELEAARSKGFWSRLFGG